MREHRSHRRLRGRVVKAAEKREKLLEAEPPKLSLPDEEGRLSIIVSGRSTFPTAFSPKAIRAEHAARMEEAERLRAERRDAFKHVTIKPRAVVREMQMDFADPGVSSIIMIGHGTINGLLTDPKGEYFTWREVSRAANHLKQGAVEQRTCGHFPSEIGYCVPFGTFAVSTLSNLRAAVGRGVELPDGNSRDHLFDPVYTDDVPLMDQIDELNRLHAARLAVEAAA